MAATARQARAVTKDESKADAEALIDKLIAGEPAGVLAFAGQLAENKAHARRVGVTNDWSWGNLTYLEGQRRRRNADVKKIYAGIKQWAKLGREVLEAEVDHPFKIQGSPLYLRKTGKVDPKTGEDEKELCAGRAPTIKVYDWTQTRSVVDGYVEPDWEAPIGAGDYATLRQLTAAADIPVLFEDLGSRNSHGFYDGRTITVDSSIPVGNQIVELARQLAHHQLGHVPAASRAATREVVVDDVLSLDRRAVENAEATLVGWLVAKSLGLDDDTDGAVTAQAAEYLTHWVKVDAEGNTTVLEGHKSRRKLLRSRMDPALKAADVLVSAYMAAGHVPETVPADRVPVAVGA